MSIESSSPFDQIYLAFDIHDVLAETESTSNTAPLFQSSGMVLRLPMGDGCRPMRHYPYPFVKELFQLLAKTHGVHLAIFTSSKPFIAKAFSEQLILNTFDEKDLDEMTSRISVLSEDQLRNNGTYREDQYNQYSIGGNQKKDLDDVYPFPTLKEQRLLIDDQSSFAAPHQTKNLLCVSGYHWTEKFEKYQNYGYKLYYCTKEEELKRIIPGKSFALFEKPDASVVIVYHDSEGQKELQLSQAEALKLSAFHRSYVSNYKTEYSIKHHTFDGLDKLTEELKKLDLFRKSDNDVSIVGDGYDEMHKSCDIMIQVSEKNPNITFASRGTITLNQKEHSELLRHIKEYWNSELQRGYFFRYPSDKEREMNEIYDLVWDKVKNHIWKEKLVKRANHILLVTGAIFSAWEESKNKQKPISEILFDWQCETKYEKKVFEPRVLRKRTDLYLKGLALLQTVKPDLEPITIKTFEAAQIKYPSLPEDGAYDHKDACVIS